MKTYTEVNVNFDKILISKDIQITSLGSCFSTEIGKKMQDSGHQILVNPFGVLYNPISIYSSLQLLYNDYKFTENDIIERDPYYGSRKKEKASTKLNNKTIENLKTHRSITTCIGGYTSYYHHGSFTRPTIEEFLKDANKSLNQSREHYSNSQTIIITFGTSWAYKNIEKNIIVSNCHKHKANEFERIFISKEQIVKLYSEIIENQSILTNSSKRNWIFTVSPIRHIKDGLHGNQISKANLLLAIEELRLKYSNVFYFPSFEIMLDELRDYKYYASDLIHPSDEAIEYIWQKLQ